MLAGRAMLALKDGDHIRTLTVVATPGHTPGHVSLLEEAASLLLVGDLVGVMGGTLSRAPAPGLAEPVDADVEDVPWLMPAPAGWSGGVVQRLGDDQQP